MSDIDKDFQQLVIARLRTMPADVVISIGDEGDLTREELLEHVNKHDSIGSQMIDIEKRYFNALKTGELYELYEHET
jgi:hypothetical protein